jgi:hypothetical protein
VFFVFSCLSWHLDIAMKTIALLAALVVQAVDPSPRALLNLARPLTNAEIAIVLAASRDAVAGTTLRFTSLFNGQGPELRLGPAGLPTAVRSVSTIEGGMISVSADGTPPTSTHFVEEVSTFIDYTGGAVRRCDGAIEPGEMVIEYVRRGAGRDWTATARRREANDVGGPGYAGVFGMLRGTGSLASTQRGQIAGRPARAFAAAWVSPFTDTVQRTMLRGDPAPNVIGEPAREESIQTLWIDAESLLPLRWEVNTRGERSHGFDFTYEPIDLQPPAGVDAPSCIR